ncbi:MAG: type II toxin-antitoxin system HicB family antitoxin [Nitrospirae bacterium]|nr:type II toxin-antitoxin system HicB family antitoxin [Nitrospirota bacterium]
MIFTYRVILETDKETGQIVASLPTLNYTADFGETVEEALARLQQLATGFLETLMETGVSIPPPDPLSHEGLYLSLELKTTPAPA